MRFAAPVVLASLLLLVACAPEQGTQMGQLAPDFTVKTVGAGAVEQDVKLSGYKDKVVLLDFWATWCGPCKMVAPVVEDLYQKYHDKGFEVMAISQEQEKILKTYRAIVKTKHPIFRDPVGEANGTYKVEALPSQVLIGRDGKVLWRQTGADPEGLMKAVESAMQ